MLRSCSVNWSFFLRLDKGIQKNSRGDNSQRTRPAAELAADRQMAGHQRKQIFFPGDQIVGLVVARRTVGVLKFMISDERAFGKLAGDMESC